MLNQYENVNLQQQNLERVIVLSDDNQLSEKILRCIGSSVILLTVATMTTAIIYHSYSTIDNTNNKYDIYDDRTFGFNVYEDPCTSISYNNKFRKRINDKVPCIGKWCVNGTFNCIRYNNQGCYNVEHIIDKRTNLNTNIVGNLVMAYGKWNQELGRKTYAESNAEKIRVYGQKSIDLALHYVTTC
jgi:hypothetical protein